MMWVGVICNDTSEGRYLCVIPPTFEPVMEPVDSRAMWRFAKTQDHDSPSHYITSPHTTSHHITLDRVKHAGSSQWMLRPTIPKLSLVSCPAQPNVRTSNVVMGVALRVGKSLKNRSLNQQASQRREPGVGQRVQRNGEVQRRPTATNQAPYDAIEP